MSYEILVAKRVSYGKASTPIQDREYKCPAIGGGSVGNRADWLEIAEKYHFAAVEFIELDGTKEVLYVHSKAV